MGREDNGDTGILGEAFPQVFTARATEIMPRRLVGFAVFTACHRTDALH